MYTDDERTSHMSVISGWFPCFLFVQPVSIVWLYFFFWNLRTFLFLQQKGIGRRGGGEWGGKGGG